MTAPFSFSLRPKTAPVLGLIALQSDETIERDFRRLLTPDTEFLVTRVPSAPEVTRDTLARMESKLARAAALFPEQVAFTAVGYGCTSGTAQIGAERVANNIRQGIVTQHVTEPVSGLIAASKRLGIKHMAFLSPYVETVSAHLRKVLEDAGIATPAFGSFDVAEEAKVARIDSGSIVAAARQLVNAATPIDGLFLSCTNLRTLDVIEPLEAELGIAVLSSNQVLAWHMMQLAKIQPSAIPPGRLFAT